MSGLRVDGVSGKVPQFNSGLDPASVATTVRTAAINALLIPAGTV